MIYDYNITPDMKYAHLSEPDQNNMCTKGTCHVKNETPPVVFNNVGIKLLTAKKGDITVHRLEYDPKNKAVYLKSLGLVEGQSAVIPKAVCFSVSNANENRESHASFELTFDHRPGLNPISGRYGDIPTTLLNISPHLINNYGDLHAYFDTINNMNGPKQGDLEDIGVRLSLKAPFNRRPYTFYLMDERNKMENRVIKSALVFVTLVDQMYYNYDGSGVKVGGKWSLNTLEGKLGNDFGGRVFEKKMPAYLATYLLRGSAISKKNLKNADSDSAILSAWVKIFTRLGLGPPSQKYPPNDELKISERQRYMRDRTIVYKNMEVVDNLEKLKRTKNYLDVTKDLKTSKRPKYHTLNFSIESTKKNFSPTEYSRREDLAVNYELLKIEERYVLKYDAEVATYVRQAKPKHLVFAKNSKNASEPMRLLVFSQIENVGAPYYMFNSLIKWRLNPSVSNPNQWIHYPERT